MLYTCQTGHKLTFGHIISKKGKISPAPTVCLSCATVFDKGEEIAF